MCQVHTGAYVSLPAPGKTDYIIPLATQERLPRTYCTYYLSLRIRTTPASQLEKKKQRKGKKMKKIKDNNAKNEKGNERKDKKCKKRQDKNRKQGKEKRKNVILADPRNWLKTALGS